MKVPGTPNGVLGLFEPFILMNGDSFTNLSQTRKQATLAGNSLQGPNANYICSANGQVAVYHPCWESLRPEKTDDKLEADTLCPFAAPGIEHDSILSPWP